MFRKTFGYVKSMQEEGAVVFMRRKFSDVWCLKSWSKFKFRGEVWMRDEEA